MGVKRLLSALNLNFYRARAKEALLVFFPSQINIKATVFKEQTQGESSQLRELKRFSFRSIKGDKTSLLLKYREVRRHSDKYSLLKWKCVKPAGWEALHAILTCYTMNVKFTNYYQFLSLASKDSLLSISLWISFPSH